MSPKLARPDGKAFHPERHIDADETLAGFVADPTGLDAKAIRQLLSAQNRVNALSKRSRSAASRKATRRPVMGGNSR
ncbi:MAG: hypothetical protein H6926_00750 [Chromatiales bacterium]|nr:hypothetical protein [Gammaproteobacteria bacterium]MCP5351708.1 hypothetical protein [Chromatiales bacterium]